MCPAAPANSTPLQQKKSADDANGNKRFMSRENGKKIAAILCNDDRDSSSRAAGRKPVTPPDDEARVFADGAARKIILSAAAGNRCAEFRERRSTKKRVKSTNDPHADKEPRVWQHFRDVSGRADNPGGDRVANSDSDAEPNAKHLQELAGAASLRASRYVGAGGRVGRCVRQCEVSGAYRKLRHHKGDVAKCKPELRDFKNGGQRVS